MKITKAMIKLWTIGMLIVIVLTLGIFSLVMGLSRVEYGFAALNFNTAEIDLRISSGNENYRQAQTWTDDYGNRTHHANARTEVFRLLEEAGSTNRLFQIFQSSGTEQMTFAQPTVNSRPIVQTNASRHYIELTWHRTTPQFAIYEYERGQFRLVNSGHAGSNNIYRIIIPLNGVSNRFQRHEWFISTNRDLENQTINRRFITWGNYYALAQFVEELRLP